MLRPVFLASLALLSAFAGLAPAASAACTYNLNVCTNGGDCYINAGYCNGAYSECYLNVGNCINDGYCSYNVGTCSGFYSNCSFNVGTCENDGTCLVNAGTCDGGSCEINTGYCSGSCELNVVTCTDTCLDFGFLALCQLAEASPVPATPDAGAPAQDAQGAAADAPAQAVAALVLA